MKQFLHILLLFILGTGAAFATHNRAGEITYRKLCDDGVTTCLTYEVIVTTYTVESSMADRDQQLVLWGDGDTSYATRINGPDANLNGVPDGEVIATDIKVNYYRAVHTYPGAGRYWISMEDPNRNADILNIPGSVNVPFFIHSLLVINPFLGNNNSPVLLNPPIDNACINNCFIHNPGAFDVDGDSLAYKLVVCRGGNGTKIKGYTYPPTIDELYLDEYTGDFVWCAPPDNPGQGEYNIAIMIEEYRGGFLIGSVLRDMQILVVPCKNTPPEIDPIIDTCVQAGDTLRFTVTARDTDIHITPDIITLTAIGGALSPFVEQPPATFVETKGSSPVSSEFVWPTNCGHVRKQPYLVSFKAKDNYFNIPLVDFESMNIRVVAPAPENPVANPSGSSIILQWDPNICSDAIGYKIYRHNGYTGWVHGVCETGVPAYTGYELIGETVGLDSTYFIDDNNGAGLIHGLDYCYMVVACFPDGAESYATLEFCARLIRDVPIITNVDVVNTSFSNGMIDIRWIKPIADANNLDTVLNPGPYEFKLLRSEGFNGANPFTEIVSFSSPYFGSLMDTTYRDTLLNTSDLPYTYRIDFYANGGLKGSTQIASSVYLSISPTDNKNVLSWEEYVPWENTSYVIYKKDDLGMYQSLDTVTTSTYSDTGLVNGVEYCYYVKSIGAYSDTSIISPLYNSSEKKCEAPVDNIPPCQPYLEIVPDCDITHNSLTWTNPNNFCADDVVQYNIYYAAVEGDDFILLASTYNAQDTFFLHDSVTSIAGCYAVTALDTALNESAYSNVACVDNCPEYELPNIFTPDGDGINDVLKPFPYKYVESIHIKVWNRWGEEVFETTNPYIGWDGRHKESKQLCADGTYYYVCKVNEIRLTGIEQRVIKGFLQILTAK